MPGLKAYTYRNGVAVQQGESRLSHGGQARQLGMAFLRYLIWPSSLVPLEAHRSLAVRKERVRKEATCVYIHGKLPLDWTNILSRLAMLICNT